MNNIMKLITVVSVLCFSTGCTKPAGSSSTASDQTVTPEATVATEKLTSFPAEMDSITAFNNFMTFITEGNYTVERTNIESYVFENDSVRTFSGFRTETVRVESLVNPRFIEMQRFTDFVDTDEIRYSISNGTCAYLDDHDPYLAYESCTIDTVRDLSLTVDGDHAVLEFVFTDCWEYDITVRVELNVFCVPSFVESTWNKYHVLSLDGFVSNNGKKYVMTTIQLDAFRDIGATHVKVPEGCIPF